MGKNLNSIDSYCQAMRRQMLNARSTSEQDLQAEMNIIDRRFIRGLIDQREWYKKQMEAIKKYRKIILK